MNEKRTKKRGSAAHVTGVPVYLDTSSLRKIGRRLYDITKYRNALTSLQTFHELLNGLRLSNSEFLRRKGTLNNMQKSKINIDWRSEEAIMLSSFNNTSHLEGTFIAISDNQIRKPVQNLVRLVLESSDLSDFGIKIRHTFLEAELEKIESYDDHVSSHWVDSFSKSQRECKQILDEMVSGQRPKPSDMEYSTTKEFSELMLGKWAALNRKMSIRAVAQRAGLLVYHCGFSNNPISLQAMYPHYNGRIDTYVDALSYWSIKKYGAMGEPGRNDGMDLMHFLYLGKQSIFLTEDRNQADIAEKIKINVMTTDGYLKNTPDSQA